MTKTELIEVLNGIRITVIFGHTATRYAILHRKEFAAEIRGKQFGFRWDEEGRAGYAVSLDMVADAIENHAEERRSIENNMFLMMKQDVVRMTYEHILHYCDEHDCFDKMKAQPWYMFARIIRNTIAHKTGAVLHRWPGDAPDSVTWRGRTIAKSDVNKVIPLASDEALHLEEEMVQFARTL